MELRRYVKLFAKWWILIVVTAVVGCGVAYATTSHAVAYSATAEIYVGNRHPAQDPIQLEEVNGFDQILQTYAAMIPSTVFAKKAVATTGVPRSPGAVAAETTASVVTNTDLVTVTVTDPDPGVAAELANGMATAFVNQIQATPASPTSSGVVPQEPAYMFETAGVPASALPTGLGRRLILGGVFGLIVAALAVLLIDYLGRAAAEERAASPSGAPAATDGSASSDGPATGVAPPASNGSSDQPARSGG